MSFLNRKTMAGILALLVAAALGLGMLAGCSSNSAVTQQQSDNRNYMSQVNQVMDDLESALANFTDAVSRDDVVGMQTQAENALATLDDLSGIEAPEDLADVKSGYEEGAGKLRDALNDYVALYTEISSSTDAQPFDWSTYDARLAEIQQGYDDGIAKLKETDELAANKEGGDAQQSSDDASGDAQQQGDGDAQ
ncbi:MAG: hypothetical protein U0L71_04430 [Eggerthellaceae bacterium]|nr:hypothetical protein [Eggerthellaceae bacterium]